MTHVTNSSPDNNAFEICFAILMIIATVVAYTCCGNIVTKESGEKIEKHEVTITRPVIKGQVATITIGTMYPTKSKEETNIKEQKVIAKKTNTIYYINENGYESYLDEKYQKHLYDMCIKYNVEDYYTLFLAQMYHESAFEEDVISKTNDYGLMQINICNHEWLGKKLGNDDFLDPYNNIEAGIYMMSNYLNKYNDVEKALVCYNMGEGAVIKGTYSTTYSKGVLDDMNLLVELKEERKE